MKIKTIGVILVICALTLLGLNYMVTGNPEGTAVSGYLILMDQKVSATDYDVLGFKEFSTIIYLPSANGEGTVTSCSFVFPDGVNVKADVSRDGRIDAVDLFLTTEALGCKQGKRSPQQELFDVGEED